MVRNSDRKKLVRARMKTTGENYTTASRALEIVDPPARTYGPSQIITYLGLTAWQWSRAVELGLLPAGDVDVRWTQAQADAMQARLGEIRQKIGQLPDIGAYRAGEYLSEKFSAAVDADTVAELARQGLIRRAGQFKKVQLYSGLDVERFDQPDLLDAAWSLGRLRTLDEAAQWLDVRPTDVQALVDAGWLLSNRRVSGQHKTSVALYRTGDLMELRDDPLIKWEDVRQAAKRRGARSLLRRLPGLDLAVLMARERWLCPDATVEVRHIGGMVAIEQLQVPPGLPRPRTVTGILRRVMAYCDFRDLPLGINPSEAYGSAVAARPRNLREYGFGEVGLERLGQVGYEMVRPAWSAMTPAIQKWVRREMRK